MTERAQLDHVLLDVNFFSDDKIVELAEEFSELAQLFVVKVLAMMSAATNGEITKLAARGVRGSIPKEEAHQIIEWCVRRGIFIAVGSESISNSRVVKDQEKLGKQQERWRRAKGISEPSPSIPRGNIAEEARKSEQLKIEELKNKKEGAAQDGAQIVSDLKTVAPSGFLRFGEFVQIETDQHNGLLKRHSKEFLDRCYEKLNAAVGQLRGVDQHKFEELQRKAKNAYYVLQNWVINEVQNEISKAEKSKPFEQRKQVFSKRPVEWRPPEKPPEPTQAERENAKKLIAEKFPNLKIKTMEGAA